MTDKQIIIDGCDVSGCKYLYTDSKYNDKCCSASIGGNCLCKPSEMICIKYVECLKEQLKAKEQELQQAMDNYVQLDLQRVKEYNELVDLYKAKEQECKELKKELEVIYDDCKGCPTCNEALYNANLYAKEYRKLKQTLIEIKEIANKVLLNTHDLEQFKDADALFGALLEIHKKSARC